MSLTIPQFIDIVRSQIGTQESPPNSNDTKYGVQFGWNGVAWCSIFAWCMYADAGVSLPVKSASVVEVYEWAQAHGFARPSTEAVPGDAIARTWTGKQIDQPGFDAEQTHMQILLGVNGSALDLAGGNQASASGGIVSYDTATAGEATILGSIAWSRLFTAPVAAPPPAHSPTPPSRLSPSQPTPMPLLYTGMPWTTQTATWTAKVQTRLEQLGIGGLSGTGAWGPKTQAAVEAFQRSRNLNVDGVVGPQTYGALGI